MLRTPRDGINLGARLGIADVLWSLKIAVKSFGKPIPDHKLRTLSPGYAAI